MTTGDGATSGTATGTDGGGTGTGEGATPPEGQQQQDDTGTQDGQQAGQEGATQQGEGDGEGDIPPKLKAALDAARRDAREAKAAARQEREAREALERERMSDADKAVADARAEGLSEGNRRLARAAVRELAVEAGFADGMDAVVFLADKGLESFVDTDSGEVDEDAIREDLKGLAERKPHLLGGTKQSGTPRGGNDHSGGGSTSDPVEEFNALLRS